jgi:hypothetical protein
MLAVPLIRPGPGPMLEAGCRWLARAALDNYSAVQHKTRAYCPLVALSH